MKDPAISRNLKNIRRLRKLVFLAVFLCPTLLFARQSLVYTPLHMVGARKVVAESRPMLDFLEQKLDLDIELHYEKVNADVVRAFQQGRIDLAEIGPLPYVALREQYPHAEAILFFVEPDGRARYTCALVTAFDGPQAMADVKAEANIPLASTQQLSTCGPLSTGYLLHKHDIDPQSVSFEILGDHEAVALAVIRGESLLAIINDVLDFSKIEADRLELAEEDFNLLELVEESADLLAMQIGDKPVEVICHVDPQLPVLLLGDPGRLRQVLLNLGSNAVKFTPRGEVAILFRQISVGDDTVTLGCEVRDTGVGIAPEQREKLFLPFEQGDPTSTRKFGGTGLGLAITKRLIDLLGGEISLDSTPGRGTQFRFQLPLKLASPPADRAQLTLDCQNASVLLAVANALQRQCLQQQLEDWRAAVQVACSVDQVLGLAQQAARAGSPIRVVLFDHDLAPKMIAALVRTLKQQSKQEPPPAVILLTRINRHPREFNNGDEMILGSLYKPVRPLKLKALMEKALFGVAEDVPALSDETDSSVGAQPPWPDKGRILLAEDNPVNCKLATAFLQRLGFEADVVENGRAALAALNEQSYDLVLMDVQMPEMDGMEAAQRIRNGYGGEHNVSIPIIALTAHAMQGDRERCLRAGMNDYLAKPIRLAELSAKLNRWVSDS